MKRDKITGTGIPIQGNDIDTDRIIPARFMKCVTFEGLGEYAFYDERFDEKKKTKKHPMNDDKFKGGSILIVNKNFGCGSSREHAPQSLQKYGIKALVGESFAEIFAGNCTVMGIPTVTAPHDAIENLMMVVEEQPDTEIVVDLNQKKVVYSDFCIDIDVPDSFRHSLVKGTWDSTSELLKNKKEVEKTATRLSNIY
ncbi:MAG TPA: 3-isopropylmalate dehydratase small subunit [Candidatus Nanoarchaeia archaeon]|nr:3-isopropylmalate dehydratase small subunit [Candidatus Nanoarchaeia archaeon]